MGWFGVLDFGVGSGDWSVGLEGSLVAADDIDEASRRMKTATESLPRMQYRVNQVGLRLTAPSPVKYKESAQQGLRGVP